MFHCVVESREMGKRKKKIIHTTLPARHGTAGKISSVKVFNVPR